jgi:WD40 repeat protein
LRFGWGDRQIAFAADGKTLAAGANDGTVTLWDVETGQERRSFRGPAGGYGEVAFSPDGTMLAAARAD